MNKTNRFNLSLSLPRLDLVGAAARPQVLAKARSNNRATMFSINGPRSYAEDEDIGRVRHRLSRARRVLSEQSAPALSFTIISTPPATPDYDDGIVWGLIDPDSIGVAPPIARYTVQTRLGRVAPGEFAPVDVDDVDLELFDDISWFEQAQERLEYLSTLQDNWDSYGAEAPNAFALQMAEQALRLMARVGLEPLGIVPSAENGIGIVFRQGTRQEGKHADIEIFNDGDVCYLVDDRQNRPQAHQVSADEAGLSTALQAIRTFLDS